MSALLKRPVIPKYPETGPAKKKNLGIQTRCLWGCARQNENQNENQRPSRRCRETTSIFDFYRRQGQGHGHDHDQWGRGNWQQFRRDGWWCGRPWWGWGWGWGWCRFKSSFSPSHRPHPQPQTRPRTRTRTRNYPPPPTARLNANPNPRPDPDPWEEVTTHFDHRLEHLKRQLENDPYTALFGKRREPFLDGGFWSRSGGNGDRSRSWGEFWGMVRGDQTNSGFDPAKVDRDLKACSKGDGVVDTTASAATSTSTSTSTSEARRGQDTAGQGQDTAEPEVMFDPITGRMVPKARFVDPDGDRRGDNRVEDGQDAVEKSKASGDISYAQAQHDPLKMEEDKGKESVGHCSEARPQPFDTTPFDTTPNANGAPGVNMAQPPKDQGGTEQLVEPEGTKPGDRIRTPGETSPETPGPLEQKASESEKESPNQEAKDLEFLSASDIRASYDSRKLSEPDTQKQETRRDLEDEFDAYVDPASRINGREIRERYHSTSEPARTEQEEYTEPANQPEPPNGSATYQILAYDSSTFQVTRAETSSSQAADEIARPTEILSRLNNPAKFLPYFASMHNDGYEIVSGGGDILVFKKVRAESAGRAGEQINSRQPRPVEQETPPNPPPPAHEHDHPPEKENPSPPKTRTKTDSTFRKVARRMLLAGSVTAATCYAIGVVTEYFRTGGADGRGIDGFTEFESERRRSD